MLFTKFRLAGCIFLLLIGVSFVVTCGYSSKNDKQNQVDDDSAPLDDDTHVVDDALLPAGVGTDPPFDVSAIIRQVHFAFRWEEDAYYGGHSNYGVRVAETGAFSFYPGYVDDSPSGELNAAPLVLHTDHITCGRVDIANAPPHLELSPSQSVLIRRGEVTEWLRNTTGGLEQGWNLDRRPSGDGDVVIRLRWSGQDYVGETESGLHFVDPDNGLGVLYSTATWIDAYGSESKVRPHVVGDFIELRVPASLVDRSIFPVVLDPLVTPEIDVDNPAYAPAAEAQTAPEIAFNGTNYLMVWADRRNFALSGYDIYGARVNVHGGVLDPEGLPLVTVAGTQLDPAAASDGQDFLVTWQDSRYGTLDILARRVLADGTVSDPTPINIFIGGGQQCSPDATFGGTNYFVVWDDDRSSFPDIYGQRIATDGTRLDGNGILISDANGTQSNARVAFDGDNYFAVWQDSRFFSVTGEDIYGARVALDGTVLDPSGVVVSTFAEVQENPELAFGTTSYLVAWQDQRNGNSDIYAARVNISGAVLDSTGFAVSNTAATQELPVVGFDNVSFLVAWVDDRNGNKDMFATRVTSSGTVISPSGIAVSEAADIQSYPCLAFDGTRHLMAWQDFRDGGTTNYDILGAFISHDDVVYPPTGLTFATQRPANLEQYPAVAFDGTNYFVVWRDLRYGHDVDIFGARITQSGDAIDSAGINLTSAVGDQEYPTVAFGDTNYLAVWEDRRSGVYDIYGTRVSLGGDVLDPGGILISDAVGEQRKPDVAFDDTSFLVAWQDQRGGDTDIYATQVDNDGVVAHPAGLLVSDAASSQEYPAVCATTGMSLVVWQDLRVGNHDIYGARVNAAGTVLDPAGFALCSDPGIETIPDVTFDGTNFLAVWQDLRGTRSDIYGARVNLAGNVLDADGFLISGATENQEFPAVSFSGEFSMVLWIDYRDSLPDLYATWIRPDGVVMLPDGAPIDVTVGGKLDPDVASAGGGHSLIVYRKNDENGIGRARARRVWIYATGAECNEDDECMTGFCVDGFCCGTECGGNNPDDCQVCSVAAGGSANGVCTPLPGTRICRPNADICDVPEYCEGSAPDCPVDSFEPATTECRASTDLCDTAEFCTGAGVACPTDAVEPITTECRPAADLCDAAEFCDSVNKECPVDELEPDTEICRDMQGPCDVIEYCDGVSKTCATDVFEPGATECRPAADICDVAEFCPADGPACPSDVVEPVTTTCRAAVDLCDAVELCDGVDVACPPDELEPVTTECRASVDVCDLAEHCDALASTCPADSVAPGTTECRAVAGDCDVTEFCDGTTVVCPADQVSPDSFECRAVADDCDIAESCDGLTIDCPVDDFALASTECRAVAGDCDINEFCPGDGPACPTDEFEPSTMECRVSADLCDAPELCPGDGPTCPDDAVYPVTRECRTAASVCDVAELCDGVAYACPTDEVADETTVCRDATDLCDAVEFCDGASVDCPDDGMSPSGILCRAVAGMCDIEELCDGESAPCPADSFMESGVECRSAAGLCDQVEACDGEGPLCPPDRYYDAGVLCRGLAHDCDGREYCDGVSFLCPPDVPAADDMYCDDQVFCNGVDRCREGICQDHLGDPCRDNLYCNGRETCDEQTRQCLVEDIPECVDDGQWCNGEELCDEQSDSCGHAFTPGTRCPDDGNWCNGAELCSEEFDQCYHVGSPCPDDGLFCNGEEACDEETDMCVPGELPCPRNMSCIEVIDECIEPDDGDGFDWDPDVGCGCL
ncbi:MAG: hypothetical protein P9L99_02735 [Candidatus Lernaella stagnicola]|nr:hypothetical protein [Candidatus Lernaella stagnicola]